MTRTPVFRPASTSKRVCVLAGGGRAPHVWPAGRPAAGGLCQPADSRPCYWQGRGHDHGQQASAASQAAIAAASLLLPLPPAVRAPLPPTVLPAPLAPISAVSTPGRNALLTPRSSCRRPLWGPSSLRASQPCTQGGRGEWEDAAG